MRTSNFLAKMEARGWVKRHATGETIFNQSDAADAIFYIRRGRVKLTAVSSRGKQAVIALLGAGDFFGEGCLAGQLVRMSNAATVSECWLVRLEKAAAVVLIRDEPAFSKLVLGYVLSRNVRMEVDLIRHLFDSTEKRLARVLLLLANFGKEGAPESVIPKVSEERLAEIIGTTRSRVGFFMNRFRTMGFIDYKEGLGVHSSLITVLLRD
jgi:CRP/FNR family transcriptional regulator, cyclic AMP receptor protein